MSGSNTIPAWRSVASALLKTSIFLRTSSEPMPSPPPAPGPGQASVCATESRVAAARRDEGSPGNGSGAGVQVGAWSLDEATGDGHGADNWEASSPGPLRLDSPGAAAAAPTTATAPREALAPDSEFGAATGHSQLPARTRLEARATSHRSNRSGDAARAAAGGDTARVAAGTATVALVQAAGAGARSGDDVRVKLNADPAAPPAPPDGSPAFSGACSRTADTDRPMPPKRPAPSACAVPDAAGTADSTGTACTSPEPTGPVAAGTADNDCADEPCGNATEKLCRSGVSFREAWRSCN